jgi:hypothetical protein
MRHTLLANLDKLIGNLDHAPRLAEISSRSKLSSRVIFAIRPGGRDRA